MELMSIKEVSRVLKVNKNKVYNLIEENELKAIKLGSLKVSNIELERFILKKEANFNEHKN